MERVVSTINTYLDRELWNIEELRNPSFYADVVGQTLMMGGALPKFAASKLINFNPKKGT